MSSRVNSDEYEFFLCGSRVKMVPMVYCILDWIKGESSNFRGNDYADECLSSWTLEVSALFLTVPGREKQVHRVVQTLGFHSVYTSETLLA